MKSAHTGAIETKDLEDLKWLMKAVGANITHIKSHDPNGPFVQAAIDFADSKQSLSTEGVWPTGSTFGFTLRNYLVTVQELFDSQKVVSAVSFFWGSAPRIRLRFQHEQPSTSVGDFMIEFQIRDFNTAKAIADDVVAISKAAKAPLAIQAASTRL